MMPMRLDVSAAEFVGSLGSSVREKLRISSVRGHIRANTDQRQMVQIPISVKSRR